MKIRTRLTLWYAGILFGALLLMGLLSYYELIVARPEGHWEPVEDSRSREHPGKRGGGHGREGGMLEDLLGIAVWCGIPAAALALGGGWWLMRKALSPVAALTEAAERVHECNLGERIARSGNGDELDRLTEVFNRMVARLDQSFQRIREFTLHASHELKTPLTVLHGELETALEDDSLTPAQRERLLSQLDEVQRLTRIVEGLNLLTKADSGQIQLKREPVALDELVRDCMEDAKVLALPESIEVSLAECEPVTVSGDRHRLRQVLLNLTDNAVKYNQPRGRVVLGLRRAESMAELTVVNSGPGISPDQLPRVFERFYRGDAAHTRSEESCGLGLSIVQWIVTAHGGSIELRSEPSVQTTATVRLPILPPPQPGSGKERSTG